ncbi:MAG: OprO/OprP family phosphate-selective porin [Gammaproteobacteria bacterium]
MQKLIKISAAVAFALGVAQPALADTAETKGGLTLKTDDGRFEMKVGGRLHLDGYMWDESDVTQGATVGGIFFRRTYLSVTGKLYGWKYKYENDFAAGSSPTSIREMWMSTELFGSDELILGQHKPFRGMEELTSSNEVLFMERPFATASGMYNSIRCVAPAAPAASPNANTTTTATAPCGATTTVTTTADNSTSVRGGSGDLSASRQFQTGVFYKLPFTKGMWAASLYNMHPAGGFQNNSYGYNTRLIFQPLLEEKTVLHLGVSASLDKADDGTRLRSSVAYAGRSSGNQVTGPASQTIATTGTDGQQQTVALEAAFSAGPFYVQGELATATFEDAGGVGVDQDVQTYYLQAAWVMTGETKPYKADRGAYGAPKPAGERGAWELKARLDTIENKDIVDREVTTTSVGVNWYANPNVRLMFDYTMGDNKTNDDDTGSFAARAQLSF